MPPPILLLKTQSTPHDNYADYFSARGYKPIFIPVLEHRFHDDNLARVKELVTSGELEEKYGGLIFTSQRAVEGFGRVLGEIGDQNQTHMSNSLPIYTVGPATSHSLTTIKATHLPNAEIHGSDTGNGENLAKFILGHYNDIHNNNHRSRDHDCNENENENENGNSNTTTAEQQQHQHQQGNEKEEQEQTPKPTKPKLPLLFLTGKQHRDVIPKTLMSESLPETERIPVHELVVYGTAVMGGFEECFREAVEGFLGGGVGVGAVDKNEVMWVVIFSPTGCDAVLRVLGLGLGSGAGGASSSGGENNRRIHIATIGPTTRDHLRKKYGVEPDVCAEKPSYDGVGKGIEQFMESRARSGLREDGC